MSFSIQFAEENHDHQARIKVIGCGGAGCNAVNTMISFGLEGVEFFVVNTDEQALNQSLSANRLTIGKSVTRGLGAGADPERGRKAAMEDAQKIKEILSGADMVFVTAGMGGGTGTGSAPVVASIAREEGALTIGVVTRPFLFEGRPRGRRADEGLKALSENVDALVTISNDKLVSIADKNLSLLEAFRKADNVLFQAVKGISDLITQSGLVNVDFADVRRVMSNNGRALMGSGIAKGEGRARMAAEMAVSSPLLDNISIKGAMGVLINVVGSHDLGLMEVQEAAMFIQEQAHEDADIIWGATIDESLGDEVKVTVIGTGFGFDAAAVSTGTTSARPASAPATASVSVPRSTPAPVQHTSTMRPQAPAYAVREPVPAPESAPTFTRRSAPVRESTSMMRTAEVAAVPPVTARADVRRHLPAFDDEWDIPTFQRQNRG